MEETCQKCGHTRYAGDLFDGGCDDCCDWMVAKLAELTAERESLSQDRNHWAFEARLMAEKVNPLEAERDALKAKLAEAARLAESTRESVGKVVDGSEAARLRAKLAKVQAWRDEMLPDCCICSDGYSKRGLIDPSCHWHDLDVPDLDAILNDAREGGEG